MSVGLSMGSTTEKNVRSGPQPSIAAASSISSGMLLTKPENINNASPAPKPRYITGIVHGAFSFSVSAAFARLNMTIWKGTIMENTQR